MAVVSILAFPVDRFNCDWSTVPGIHRFLACIREKEDINLLLEKSWMDMDEWESMKEYHDSISGFTKKYLPTNLNYVEPVFLETIPYKLGAYGGELGVVAGIRDVHLWMLAVMFFSSGFLAFPDGVFAQKIRHFAKDWAVRGDFVEEMIFNRAQHGELGFDWLLLTSIKSKKSNSDCLTILSEDLDFLSQIESSCENIGLTVHRDLFF